MPVSRAGGNLYTRKTKLGGATATTLDIDGLTDIGGAIADADLIIVDDGGGGTNRKVTVTRLPTYVFSSLSLDEDNMASDSATKFPTQQSTKAYIDGKSITVSDGSNTSPITLGGTLTFAGTTNEIEVGESSGTITIGLPDNVTIAGNLTVSGTTTTVSSSTVTVNDPLFALADNNSGDAVDIGWYGKFVASGTKYSGLFRDASDSDKWKLFATTGNSNEAPSTTVNTTSGFALATLAVGGLEATSLTIGGTAVSSTAAELNILDGVTSTATELNLLDGGTSASSTTLADADRLIVNDAGTMKQVDLSDFETYFETSLDTLSNVTTVGALNSGSITSGFGTIDTGSSAITTTGLISGGSLDIDDVLINGSNIGHTDDTDLMVVANGVLTVNGEISVTTLDIGGTNVTSTAAELNILDGVTSTTAELNILDGVTSTTTELNIIDGNTGASTVTLADADRIVVNDDGTMKQVALTSFETYFESALDTLSNVTTVGTIGTGVWEATDVAVAHGGTGASTLTANGILIGNGTSAVTAVNMSTKGHLIIGDGSGNPQALGVGSDDYILTADSSAGTGVAWKASGLGTFYLEDDDGTEVSIGASNEVKIIGAGVTTNWTDTSTGNDGDPYDLTITVDAAQTVITSLFATDIKIGEDDETKVDFETADEIHFYAANVHQVKLVDNAFTPQADSDVDLGASGTYWKDAFIDSITTTGNIELGHASDTTIARASSGDINIEGNIIYRAGGTDVPVADGGTGASTLTDGGVLLGSGTGAVTAMAVLADGEMIVGDGTTDPVAESGATLRTSIGIGTGNSPQFTGIELGHASDTTIARASSGAITVEGTAVLLAGAQTGVTTILNASTKVGRDADNLIDFATTDNKIIMRVNGVNEVELVENALSPVTSDGVALGTGSLMWSDLFLASGSVVNFNNGDVTLTHTSNTLTVAGGSLVATVTGDVTGDLTGNADTATLATTVTITDNESTNENNAVIFTAGGDTDGGNLGLESDGNLTYNPSSGTLTATAFSGALTGNVTGTADVATVATTVTITDNENTNETNAIIFTAGGDLDGGNIGLESDGDLTYNPSSGTLSATTFSGALTGNVTGNASGTSATVTGAAQSNITSLGTLTTLTVDDININGKIVTMTGSTDDTAVMTVGTNGTLTIETTDTAAAAANIQITADGTAELAGTTVTLDSGGAVVLDSATGIVNIQDGGSTVLSITEGNSGDVTIQLETNGKDLVFTDNGDATNMKILDAAAGINVPGEVQTTGIGYTDGDNALTIADGGGITVAQDLTMSADKSINLPQGAKVTFTDAITDDSIDDHDAQGIIFTFTAGATVTPFSPVYLHSDNEVREADSSAIATMPCIGVSINTSDVTDGNPIEVMLMGLIRDETFSNFTAGSILYVSTTVGELTNDIDVAAEANNEVIQVVGHAIGQKLVFIQPCLTTLEHGA